MKRMIADGHVLILPALKKLLLNAKEIDEMIQEYGRQAILEFNMQGVHPEIVTLLGKLHFRTSYSQNVLMHYQRSWRIFSYDRSRTWP